ncbi:MAG: hypothetical protein ACLUTA_11205 [Blautia wexlerae]
MLLKWNDITGADGYRIYRRKKGTSKWTKLADLDYFETSYTDEMAVPKTVCDYCRSPIPESLAARISLGDYSSTGYICQTMPFKGRPDICHRAGWRRHSQVETTRHMSPATFIYRADDSEQQIL